MGISDQSIDGLETFGEYLTMVKQDPELYDMYKSSSRNFSRANGLIDIYILGIRPTVNSIGLIMHFNKL